MFAVIKTGGKQYRVAADDLLKVEKISGEAGDTVMFDTVLMVGGETDTVIGTPTVEGASVAAEVVEQARNRKIIIFKKKRRQNYRRKKGHRQEVTLVRITDILTGGAKPAAKAAKKPAKAEAAAPADKASEATAAPAAAAEAASGADDLKKLQGLGPAIEKKLNAAGVTTYAQIASMTDEDVARVEDEAGIKGRFERDNWVEQAKELAGK
ncbi:LSU ribosomal protein L21P [Breoghania corrubedonensis]|uniref:Large ribosomal subunit protein bL21 n=1 Tax=Breoghania corrubedonensis TaxID=665038 RepID=A0A2T5VGK5_9HYPH|nr:50S ribosomal protein L21 [Breoghania corrubedonensis]PTW62887.1 LSU ribosomal protein L21P [Breoghania corrubedonensis]